MLHSLDDHLTDTLGCAHDIGRIDRFIGRDQYHTLRSGSSGSGCNIICSKYVILDSLIRAVFHKRYMLVCCCMEHNLRMIVFKDAIHAVRITH